MEDFLTLDRNNIESEHLCCAISDKKSTEGYALKREWLKAQIEKGYVFRKLNVRAKVFMEYGPSEIAFMLIDAPNYMVINCFWVSGQYKGKGYAKSLLNDCIEDSKARGFSGVAVLCSDKKRPFVSDRRFFEKQGFEVCDKAEPYFELMALRWDDAASLPKLKESTKGGKVVDNSGFVVIYSHRCPYMNYYIDLQQKIAGAMGVPYEVKLIENQQQAEASPCPFTVYALYYKGDFVTQELMAEKKFTELVETCTANASINKNVSDSKK